MEKKNSQNMTLLSTLVSGFHNDLAATTSTPAICLFKVSLLLTLRGLLGDWEAMRLFQLP